MEKNLLKISLGLFLVKNGGKFILILAFFEKAMLYLESQGQTGDKR